MTTIATAHGTLEQAFVFHPGDGCDLYAVAREVSAAAAAHKRPVVATYNSVTFIGRPGVTADDLIKVYWTRKN